MTVEYDAAAESATEALHDLLIERLKLALAESAAEHLDHTGLTCFQDYGRGGDRRDDCCSICAAANHVMAAIKELE